MISFITSTIDNPWTDTEIRNFEKYGFQRDAVQYNSYYNWRIKLTDKNMFLCSLKTNGHDYKNIYLFAVTRRLFYFVIFIPQLEVIKQWGTNSQVKKLLSNLPLTSKCLSSSNRELSLDDEVLFLDGSCVLVKVNAPVDGFLFPRNKAITNKIIKKQYALLNNLYFQFEREFEGLENMIGEYNKKIGVYNEKLEKKIEAQKEKFKRILVRKGVRLGVSAALAAVTGGLSLSVDALFGLDDITDIQDVIDMVDAADFAGDAMDAFDAYDILDVDLLDFSVEDMADINISDIGEGDDLLIDSYDSEYGVPSTDYESPANQHNISFGANANNLETDINYNEGQLKVAKKNIEHYSGELRRSNISKTYSEECQNKLEKAVHKANEMRKKLAKLKDELEKVTG